MCNKKTFKYGEDRLTAGIALEICRGQTNGVIDDKAAEKIESSYLAVRTIAEGDLSVYGINTGFGPLCTTRVSPEDTIKLQYNILRSHSCGVGQKVPREIAKLMMILKVHSLAQGYSGIARSTLDRIVWHISNDVVPVVPNQGSVGASGDLAPLAHLFLPLIRLGRVTVKGEEIDAAELFQREGLESLQLGPKEGLALINGTQFIAAYAVKGLERFNNCLDTADIIGSMTLEALKGSIKPYDEKLHELRPYRGSSYVAHRCRVLVKDSQILASHQGCQKVQDPYSLRCIPQVHGASRDAYTHLKHILEVELNSVTDNPIVFDKDNTISGGNFHGQPIAIPLDYATIAASELGNISDRRIYLLLEGNEGLPKLLMKDIGINSGFMIPQYTSAALVTENKTLCFPASADSVTTSLGQEDHVSMGSISGRKLNQVIDNLENILAVELLTAAQAFDFRAPMKSNIILETCHDVVRERIDVAHEDRLFGNDLIVAREIIQNKSLVLASLSAAEKNNIDLAGNDNDCFGLY